MNSRILLLSVLCGLTSGQVIAKKLYKYQDEKGVWHYSDEKPDTDQKVDIRQMKVANKKLVWLEQIGQEKEPDFIIRNAYHGPIEVEISLHKHNNITVEPVLPERFTIKPGKSEKLFGIRAENLYQNWGYALHYSYVVGDPASHHDRNHLYLPPIQPGSVFQVTQGFGGQFSHQDEQNKYAIDIAMPIGTPVHAARSGLVMKVDDDFFKGGADNRAYLSRANTIRVLHDDGSMAVYAHLAVEQARVYPGQRIYAGQLIAHSGNTGFSTGPHLHFSVQVNKGMQLVSVPFKFSEDDSDTGPSTGTWLSTKGTTNMGRSHEQ